MPVPDDEHPEPPDINDDPPEGPDGPEGYTLATGDLWRMAKIERRLGPEPPRRPRTVRWAWPRKR